MNNNDKIKATPEERVDKMNGIFDRLVLPMILFTLAMFIVFGLIPKIGSCGNKTPDVSASQEQQSTTADDFYTLRSILLSDIEENRSIFEAAGYLVMQNEGAEPMAYRQLASGAEIIDNLSDSSGSKYSVIYRTDPQTGIETNIMIYSKTLFMVLVVKDGQSISAVFYDDAFTQDASPSDAGQSEVLAAVSSQELISLLDEYKASMKEIIE